MAHKFHSLNFRNKKVGNSLIYRNRKFEFVNCQYADFGENILFENCIFDETVVFGSELSNQAFCSIHKDLIFNNCIFKKQVLLDGVVCNAHIIFKNCKFNYKSKNIYDYALSISNANVKIGIELAECHFVGGINFSATIIERVGCLFHHTIIDNKECGLNFDSAEFGKEFSFVSCYVNCLSVSFDSTIVNKEHGHFIWRGNFLYHISIGDIASYFIKEKTGLIVSEATPIESYWEIRQGDRRCLLCIKRQNFIDTIPLLEAKSLLHSGYHLQRIDEDKVDDFFTKNQISEERVLPVGDSIICKISDDVFCCVIYYNGIFIFKFLGNEGDIDFTLKHNEYGTYLFKDTSLKEGFELGYHCGVRKIEVTKQNKLKSLSIYTRNYGFNVYDWNYFKLQNNVQLSYSKVGCGLYIQQTEIFTPIFDISNISAEDNVKFEDVILRTTLFTATSINAKNIILSNIDFRVIDYNENIWRNDVNIQHRGIDLKFSFVKENLTIKDVLLHNCIDECQDKSVKFYIDMDFCHIGSLLQLEGIGFKYNSGTNDVYHPKLTINLNKAEAKQWICNIINWSCIKINIEDFVFNDMKINNLIPEFKTIKLLIRYGIVQDGYIQLLKRVENLHSHKLPNENEADKFWKYRYMLQLRKRHRWSFPIVNLWYKLILNYGLSCHRLLMLLFLLMVVFDLYVFYTFKVSIIKSVVWGVVVLSPINFEDNLVNSIITIDNPSFLYSSVVVLYKACSYVLLAIIIATFGGFFKGHN